MKQRLPDLQNCAACWLVVACKCWKPRKHARQGPVKPLWQSSSLLCKLYLQDNTCLMSLRWKLSISQCNVQAEKAAGSQSKHASARPHLAPAAIPPQEEASGEGERL